MFSDAPFSAAPLSSLVGRVFVCSVEEGAGAADLAGAAQRIVALVLETPQAQDVVSGAMRFVSAVEDGADAQDEVVHTAVLPSAVVEVSGAQDAAAPTLHMGVSVADGTKATEVLLMSMRLAVAVDEWAAPSVEVRAIGLWEFVNTSGAAGWAAVPTGVAGTWKLVKTRDH